MNGLEITKFDIKRAREALNWLELAAEQGQTQDAEGYLRILKAYTKEIERDFELRIHAAK